MTVENTQTVATGATLELCGLTKIYRSRRRTKVAVDGLSLSIRAGEFFSLLGVNGAGKTTTIKMLSCLSAPTEGDARLDGHSIVKDPAAVRRIINVSPQNTAVGANLTVRENLELMAGLWGMNRKASVEAADRIIARMELTRVADDYAKTLSGGWQRRLSIAMALITDPKILFLDEPTLGLDVLARRELWSVIAELKGHITVILTTHYLEEAEALSDRIGIMADGKLRALGTVSELCAMAGTEAFEDAFVELATGKGAGV